MSKLKVNELDTESGTTITVAAGKTLAGTDIIGSTQIAANAVTLAEMAGLVRGKIIVGDASGDPSALTVGTAAQVLTSDGTDAAWTDPASGGTEWQAVQTAAFTAVAGKGYPVNTTAGVIAVTLPAGSVGDVIEIIDYAGTAATNNITVAANGTEKIKGVASETFFITGDRVGVRIVYIDATQGWVAATAANDITSSALSNTTDVEYLVVGGGGGGGTGTDAPGYGRGAGGAGGYRTNFGGTVITFTPGITYTATIGGGGAASTNGVDSSLAGSDITNIVSAGGGSGTNAAGQAGGSGGGGTQSGAGGAGNTPSTSPAQGFAGGSAAGMDQAAGGGGASEVGESVSTPSGDGGDGGDGAANAITGTSITYAGGGGGGGNTVAGVGGAGGGGTGYKHSSYVAATPGTDGLGGGGGGGAYSTSPQPTAGGTGGDGSCYIEDAVRSVFWSGNWITHCNYRWTL